MIIPDYIFNEMLSITKVFSECRQKSIRHDNAIRKGALLHKKLLRLKENGKEKNERSGN